MPLYMTLFIMYDCFILTENEMKYRQQDEGESEKETTSPKVVEVPPLAEDSTGELY